MATSSTHSGTAVSAASVITTLRNRVSMNLGWGETYAALSAVKTTKVNEAMTVAADAAATWNARGWWWSQKLGRIITSQVTLTAIQGSSGTVTITAASHGLAIGQYIVIGSTTNYDGAYRVASAADANTITYTDPNASTTAETSGTIYVASYPVRTTLSDFYAATSVYWKSDQWRLAPMSKMEFDANLAINPNTISPPYKYCLFQEPDASATALAGGILYMGLKPVPNEEANLFIPYILRHPTLDGTADDGDLIVPVEFHQGVYVDAAVYLLKRDILDGSALQSATDFSGVMRRMSMSHPQQYDRQNNEDKFPDAVGAYPHNRKVDFGADTIDIYGTVSV